MSPFVGHYLGCRLRLIDRIEQSAHKILASSAAPILVPSNCVPQRGQRRMTGWTRVLQSRQVGVPFPPVS